MKIIIDIEPKEMVDLAKVLQDRLDEKFSNAVINALYQKIRSEMSENSRL